MNCASCGTALPDNAMFCPGCGQRITVQRRAPAPTPQPASAPRPAAAPRSAPAPLLPREDVQAALAARQELGERMEPELIDAFLDRVEQALDARLDARVEARLRRSRAAAGSRAQHLTGRIAASLGLGIPLTAIAGGMGEVFGIIAVWASIVILNIYYTEVEKKG